MPQIAIIYARCANDEGLGSLETQISACHAYADQNGLSVRDILSDATVSGLSSTNRPGLSKLFQRISEGDVERVLCTSLDRLTRDPKEAEEVLDRLMMSGVRLQTVASNVLRSSEPGAPAIH